MTLCLSGFIPYVSKTGVLMLACALVGVAFAKTLLFPSATVAAGENSRERRAQMLGSDIVFKALIEVENKRGNVRVDKQEGGASEEVEDKDDTLREIFGEEKGGQQKKTKKVLLLSMAR